MGKMNKKLIFRILGAVSSALIIVSIFIPFISVSGYSQSLWEAYSNTNALYLPIMIIVFGLIGVLFFSLNVKTEIAYSTAGALLFYLITETISFIDQDMMKTLSVGYYCLAIGTLLTAVMAFLCNLKFKQKGVNKVEQPENPVEIITQMDTLYGNESQNIPLQPIPDISMQAQPASPIPDMSVQAQPVVPILDMSNNMNDSLNPVVAEFSVPISTEQTNVVSSPIEQTNVLDQTSNPVVNEFNSTKNTVFPDAPVKVEPKVENTTSNNLDIFN